MKRLVLLILLVGKMAYAQYSTVTANVIDSDGSTWNNGTYQFTFVPPSGYNGTVFTFNGTAWIPSVYQGSLSNTGVLNVPQVERNDFIQPANSHWQITLCPNASFRCSAGTIVRIQTPTADISSQLVITAPRFAASNNSGSNGSFGYADVNVSPQNPPPGSFYFNVNLDATRVWNGHQWSTGGGGSEGPQGPQGPSGARGPMGPQGPAGPQGPQGTQGTTGATGTKGEAGTPGATGPAGQPGPQGATGPQGPKGDSVTGPMGPTGPLGPQGATGPAGPKGDSVIGPQGPQGPSGAQGASGPAGPKGETGSVGPMGPIGPQGASGPVGPKGDSIQGPQGPTGPRGQQGLMGQTGPPGPTGATGPQGPKGPAGGPPGPPGANGTNGADGAPGATGAMGPAGPPGGSLSYPGVVSNNFQGMNVTGNVAVSNTTVPTGFASGILATPASFNPNQAIDVVAAGAKGDGRTGTAGSTTSGSTTVTVTAGGATSADINKVFIGYGAGSGSCGANTCPLVTTITGVTNASTITVATAASTTVTSTLSWLIATNDHDAIMRAQAQACTGPVGANNLGCVPIKFPRPPAGNFYLTSTLTWQGVSMYGEVSSQGNNIGVGGPIPVVLRSMPGQDLWNYPDTNDVNTTFYSKAPVVQHMSWSVDDSIDASAQHPHRKPGRTVNDAVTNSTNTVTSAKIGCVAGDIGQQLKLTYADSTSQIAIMTSCNYLRGTFGTSFTIAGPTPLVSTTATLGVGSLANTITVASATGISVGQVALVGSFPTSQLVTVTNVNVNTVTLSASSLCRINCGTVYANFYDPTFVAAQSQSSVTLYVSLDGISANQTIGNCALAIDNRDANTANWLNNKASLLLSYAVFRDMSIVGATSNNINNTGGFYTQGTAGSAYGSIWENIRIVGPMWPMALQMPMDTNPLGTSGLGGDQDKVQNVMLGGTYPLIVYNGAYWHLGPNIQIGAITGPQIMAAWGNTYTQPISWEISFPEIEQNAAGAVGFRLEGYDHILTNSSTSSGTATSGVVIAWDASTSKCIHCVPRGSNNAILGQFLMGGVQNEIEIHDSLNWFTVFDDMANGNLVTGLRPSTGFIYTRPIVLNGGRTSKALNSTGEFLGDTPLAPYLNRSDLFIWPRDLRFSGGFIANVVNDQTSFTGGYAVIPTSETWVGNYGWPSLGYQIGTNIPATKVSFAMQIRCPVITSFTLNPYLSATSGGTNTFSFGAQTISCTTNWTNVLLNPIDLSTYSGNYLNGVIGATGEVDIAWMGFQAQARVTLLQLPAHTVATLTTCSSATSGTFSVASDVTSPTYNTAVVGGGAVVIPVFCNGTAWVAH